METWAECGQELAEDCFKVLYKVTAVFLTSTTKYSYGELSFSARFVHLKHPCVIHTHTDLLQNFLLRTLPTKKH